MTRLLGESEDPRSYPDQGVERGEAGPEDVEEVRLCLRHG